MTRTSKYLKPAVYSKHEFDFNLRRLSLLLILAFAPPQLSQHSVRSHQPAHPRFREIAWKKCLCSMKKQEIAPDSFFWSLVQIGTIAGRQAPLYYSLQCTPLKQFVTLVAAWPGGDNSLRIHAARLPAGLQECLGSCRGT